MNKFVIAAILLLGSFIGVIGIFFIRNSTHTETSKPVIPVVNEIKEEKKASISATPEIPPPPDQKILEPEYILPLSGSQKITAADLVGFTPWDLKVARNEIYARHGRSFVHKDLACYFTHQSWYKPDPNYDDTKLSAIEVSNAVFILNFEKATNSPLVDTDSGCNS